MGSNITKSRAKETSLKNKTKNVSPSFSAKKSQNQFVKRTFTIKQGDEYSPKNNFCEINQWS